METKISTASCAITGGYQNAHTLEGTNTKKGKARASMCHAMRSPFLNYLNMNVKCRSNGKLKKRIHIEYTKWKNKNEIKQNLKNSNWFTVNWFDFFMLRILKKTRFIAVGNLISTRFFILLCSQFRSSSVNFVILQWFKCTLA